MSVIGTGALSLRKKDLQGSKLADTAYKKVVFAHKASAGDTAINLAALVLPSAEMPGFTQPSATLLSEAKLSFYRKNLTLISSARGVLQDYVSYNVTSNTSITFTDSFGTALDGEIFTGIIDATPRNGLVGVDTVATLATGTLTASTSDFSVGKSFRTNANPNSQIGDVAVYLDGILQFRNVGNATAAPGADGNYEEVDNGFGDSTIVRFNVTDTVDRSVIVLNTGHSVIRPDGSMMDELEATQGQVDAMIPTLATLAGVPESNFQAAPNSAQLKQFGDRVLSLEEPGSPGDPRLADAATTGAVSTGSQTFTGDKTFQGVIDIQGSYRGATLTTDNGPTTVNTLDVSNAVIVKVQTSTGNVTLNGFSGGVVGQVLHIYKASSSNTMTINHLNGSGTQQFLTRGGVSETRDPGEYGGFTVVFDGTHWRLIS